MKQPTKAMPTVMDLERTWMLVQEGRLEDKEYGQLRILRNKCGPATLPIIEFVLHGWPEFTDRVKKQSGFESVPPLPHVGFLLKFHLIAAAMMAEAHQLHKEKGDTTVSGSCN